MTVSHSCAASESCAATPGLPPDTAVLPVVASRWRNGRWTRNDGKQGRRNGVVEGVCKESRFIKRIFVPSVSETIANGGLPADGGRRGRIGREHERLFSRRSPPAQGLSRPKGSALHPLQSPSRSLEQSLLPWVGHHYFILKDSLRILVIPVDMLYGVDPIVRSPDCQVVHAPFL